jgi:RNA polymerase sigma factor (sigma-70 family)
MLVDAREVAEEVVQEAFVGLHRRWDRVDNPPGYLRISVLNGCRSVLRRRQVARSHQSYWEPPVTDASTPVLIAEEHREVMRAVHRLPRRQREVLILKYWQDIDDTQIARTLSISESSVRATASRARQALAALLEDR